MSEAHAVWALFGPDQDPFAGMDLGIRPALRLIDGGADEASAPHQAPGEPTGRALGEAPGEPAGRALGEAPAQAPIPGQLCLTWNQMLLSDLEPEPRQPSLLPVPLPWEQEALPGEPGAPAAPAPGRAKPAPTRARAPRRPRRRDLGEDQLTLFA